MPLGHLFETPQGPRFDRWHAFAGITLIRALEYPNADYVTAWRNIMGFGQIHYHYNADGWPLPWVTLYHTDGTVMAFAGLRNFSQMLSFYTNTALAPYYRCPGSILTFPRLCHEAIRATLETEFDNAFNKNRLVLFGHSCGGALASVVYSHFRAIAGATVPQALYTFGAPRAGDDTFSASFNRTRIFAVENDNDFVPAFPWTTSGPAPGIMNALAGQVCTNVGLPVTLLGTGETRMRRDWNSSPATVRGIFEMLRDPSGRLGIAHQDATYAVRLSPFSDEFSWENPPQYVERLKSLNTAMDFGVNFYDKLTPSTHGTTAPATGLSVPTVAGVQTRPTSDGNPAGPPATPPNTALVGVTTRVYAESDVSRSPFKPKDRFFTGSDRRLIERYLFVLRLFLRRDALLARPRTSTELSSLRPFCDETEIGIYRDCLMLEDYFQRLLDHEFVVSQP